MIFSILEVLEPSFALFANDESKLCLRSAAIDVASCLLTLPVPPPVQIRTTALLAALHNTKSTYHSHKVS